MRNLWISAGLLLTFGLTGTACAGEAGDDGWLTRWCRACGLPCRSCPAPCPDDYHSKPMPPCPAPVTSCTCERYIPKPIPCTKPVTCGCPALYHPKPLPCVPPYCCYPPWYTCGPNSNPNVPCTPACATLSSKSNP